MPSGLVRMRFLRLMVVAFLLTVASYVSFFAFVHTYCENRPVMLVLAALGVGTLYLLARAWPLTLLRRVGAIFAVLLCLSEITFNLWFWVWATRVCAEQRKLR